MEPVFQNAGWTTPPKTKPLHEAHISTNGNVDNFDFLFLAHAFRTPTTLFLSIGRTTVFNLSLATSLHHLGTKIVLECATRVYFATCSKKHIRTLFVSFSPWNQTICSALATCEKNEKNICIAGHFDLGLFASTFLDAQFFRWIFPLYCRISVTFRNLCLSWFVLPALWDKMFLVVSWFDVGHTLFRNFYSFFPSTRLKVFVRF